MLIYYTWRCFQFFGADKMRFQKKSPQAIYTYAMSTDVAIFNIGDLNESRTNELDGEFSIV